MIDLQLLLYCSFEWFLLVILTVVLLLFVLLRCCEWFFGTLSFIFVILLILLGIALAIVKRLLTSLTEFRLFGGINKILGFIFGLAQAYIVLSIILVALSYIPAPGILEAIQAQIDASYVTKMLAENNWIGNWLISTVLP